MTKELEETQEGIQFDIEVKKYPKEGYLQHTYSALRNLKNIKGEITNFEIPSESLNIALRNLILECQPSYDGTVNLIINDDVNVPRIINTRFTKKENNSFKVINRNQEQQTNLYEEDKIDQQTRLIKNSRFFPKIELLDTPNSGCLKGGNYTLYLRYIDGDYNESPVMCESGQISIFHGTYPSGVSGALSDELTTKAIRILVDNLDRSYHAFKLYYVRNYSDLSGTRLTEAKVFTNEYTFTDVSKEIVITGYELTDDYTTAELNVRYQNVDCVKTQAQVQNMLFFGNISKSMLNSSVLQQCSYYIGVSLHQDESIGYVDEKYGFNVDSEYYNPQNIYYKLGYWPGEYYRMGIVYIMNDDSVSPVFNLRGCVFNKTWSNNTANNEDADNLVEYFSAPIIYNPETTLEDGIYLTSDSRKINTFGLFKTPKETVNNTIINKSGIKPWYFKMKIPTEILGPLKECGVKGFFFVRQKRIPTIFGQGVAFGVDKTSYAPMIPFGSGYELESFLNGSGNWDEQGKGDGTKGLLKNNATHLKSLFSVPVVQKQSSCLISVDADTSPSLQSTLNGADFTFEEVRKGKINRVNRLYNQDLTEEGSEGYWNTGAIYVSSETPYKFVKEYGFSTKFGSAEEVKSLSFVGKDITNTRDDEDNGNVYSKENTQIIRGCYTGIVGILGNLNDGNLYNIRIPDYHDAKVEEYFNVRKNDLSDYFATSDRFQIPESELETDIFRGDCYTNTVTVRLTRNFVDPDTPIMDTIVDEKTWKKNYKGFLQMTSEKDENATPSLETPSGSWSLMNKSDINAVPLGTWFTYKCLSSNNLGLRAIDRSNVDEEALLGNPRGFYPISGTNTFSSGKVPDSTLLNLGYSSTVGVLSYFADKKLPYQKELFDNRIMFSNIQVEDEFQNGYRVFQNLAYKDIDRQYGAIVKLLPWGTDLLCVFEHGIGIVPVNEKALIQTTTNQSIHMYGAGVLQSQISLITGDYGSVWQESIIRTPIGVYGVDTFAKKIWRYSQHKGFETISDMVIQRFLNDNILLDEQSNVSLGLLNIKTHYNNYKGDVMFTFYNHIKGCEWNLCYNECLGKWITRYSWTPLYSENINNIFYSFNKKQAEILALAGSAINGTCGLKLNDISYGKVGKSSFTAELTNASLNEQFRIYIDKCTTSYLDNNGFEHVINLPIDFITITEGRTNIIGLDADILKNNWNSLFSETIVSTKDIWIPIFKDDGDNDEEITKDDYYTELDDERKLLELGYNDIHFEDEITIGKETFKVWSYRQTIDSTTTEYNPPCEIPLYLKLDLTTSSRCNDSESAIDRSYSIALMVQKYDESGKIILNQESVEMYDKMFINGVYVHGRAGIFDEIDYTDDSLDNQILPTRWYDKQEPFEFEFVVNDPIGIHKVFENLVIISNNVAPEFIQFEIEGDSYSMWRTLNGVYDKNLKKEQYQNNTLFKNASVKWDTILNQYSILMTQECKSIEKFGRRLGNMHYKEDAWYITINPLLLLNKDGKVTSSTKLRDKYLKVRVRYSGEDLAVITAIKSMVNLSAS